MVNGAELFGPAFTDRDHSFHEHHFSSRAEFKDLFCTLCHHGRGKGTEGFAVFHCCINHILGTFFAGVGEDGTVAQCTVTKFHGALEPTDEFTVGQFGRDLFCKVFGFFKADLEFCQRIPDLIIRIGGSPVVMELLLHFTGFLSIAVPCQQGGSDGHTGIIRATGDTAVPVDIHFIQDAVEYRVHSGTPGDHDISAFVPVLFRHFQQVCYRFNEHSLHGARDRKMSFRERLVLFPGWSYQVNQFLVIEMRATVKTEIIKIGEIQFKTTTGKIDHAPDLVIKLVLTL